MNDIDDVITLAMRARAEGDVLVEDLLTRARLRGVRRLRRNRVLAAVGATAAFLVAATAFPWSTVTTDRAPTATASRADLESSELGQQFLLGDARPPAAAGATTLAGGGTAGVDPRLLHLDTTDPGAKLLHWSSGPGSESLRVRRAAAARVQADEYLITVAGSEVALDQAATGSGGSQSPLTEPAVVQGRPATLSEEAASSGDSTRRISVRWRAADGVWVQVSAAFPNRSAADSATDRHTVVQFAGWVRFDRVFRCVVGFRLTRVPTGSELTECKLTIYPNLNDSGSASVAASSVWLRADGKALTVVMQDAGHCGQTRPDTEIAGRSVDYDAQKHTVVWLFNTRCVLVATDPRGAQPSRDELLGVIGGFEPVANTNLANWPNDPLR